MAPAKRRHPDGTATPGRLAAAGPGRFELSGDIGFEDAARLLAEGDAAFGALKQAELDLAGVARVDSAGLALLLEWSLAARSAGQSLRYRNIPPAIASLAGISDVAELLAPVPGG
jgi:phospholipid transport system transporter-binding protein